MRVRKIGMHERRNMAHISNSPFCFWVLRFPLFSSLFLQKPKPTREHPLFFSYPPFYLFAAFSLLADPHRSLFSPFFLLLSIAIRQISSIFTIFRWISSVPGQIQESADSWAIF